MPATLQILKKARKSTTEAIRAHAHEVATGTRVDDGKGLIIPQKIKTLLDLLSADDLSAVVRVYRDAMTAMRRVWIDQGKDENGRAKGYWQEEPDHKTRIRAADMVAAYMEGLPIQRQVQLRGEFTELGPMLDGMRLSGEAHRLLPSLASLPSAVDGAE